MQQPPTSGGTGGTPRTCQICGAENPPVTATCQVCHANLMSDSLRCQMCGAVSPPGSEACMVCGASLVQRSGPGGRSGGQLGGADHGRGGWPALRLRRAQPARGAGCIVCGARLVGPIAYQMIGTLMPALEMSLELGQGVSRPDPLPGLDD